MPRAAKPADKAREPDSKPDTSGMSTLLRAWSDGDQSALEGLTPMVYEEHRRLAHYYMERERSGHSLQTTALVNGGLDAPRGLSACSGSIEPISSRPRPR